jgi:glyoxylase-like metal-dependent hydrolase (beta-lactamase superfamily II)
MIHGLAIRTPFAVGPVNCYLVDEDPLTLFDTGPNWGTALIDLERGLAEHGRRVEELERIVLTHQHSDHLGLLGLLVERSGAEVIALAELAPVVEDFDGYYERNDALAEALMLRHGVAPEVVTALRAVSRAHRGWGGSAPVARVLRDGERLEFAGRAFDVFHRPGHSPSDTVFFDAASGELVAGDHLIRTISSNPVISLPLGGKSGEPGDARPHALELYIRSLEATRELPARRVLPGHGEAFDGHAALIDERFAMHERRAAKIAGLIAEQPRTAHEIAQSIWGKVAYSQAFLTLSEVLGHVDLLTARGEIEERDEDGVTRLWTR